jgi:hypothetical protein
VAANPGEQLASLLALWRKNHGRPATGGWWSLAGFSYQAAAFLARFFQRVEQETIEPGTLAEMESISDIVCPADGFLRLIQVKRTLDLKAMRAFLKEAYLLTDLCRNHLSDLLPHLRFQVACRARITPQDPADVPMSEVLADGDAACWREMLDRIDPITPVLEERDPLDELSVVFWNAGIREPAGLLDRLLGRLLSGFLAESPDAMRSIGRELWGLYAGAERRREWTPVGRVLTSAQVQLDPEAADNKRVLAGQTPKLEHLRRGFFRNRPAILKAVRSSLEEWLSRVESEELIGKVPVFWIAGRSGEGKSVLLLQLLSELLRSVTGPAILQVTPGEVKDLLALSSKWPPEGSGGRPLVVVDDIYDQHDREAWEQEVRDACTLETPPVCLLTCGPTEQLEQFSSRLTEVFEMTSFVLPPLGPAELDEFVAWYLERSGLPLDPASLTRENPLLVQLVFELAQGVRMPEFALRFRRRLKEFGVYDVARTIVAATALYLDAPLGVLTEWRVRDELERLCRDDQLHFRIDSNPPGGVRLAHPHLAWLLFQEWIQPPETVEKALAREIHQVMETRARDSAERGPFAPIHSLLGSTHLGEASESGPSRPADRKSVIRETYRLHLGARGGHPDVRALPAWLRVEARVDGLNMVPTPSSEALCAMEEKNSARLFDGSVAWWMWLLSENADRDSTALTAAVERFLFAMPENPGIAQALKRILARSQRPEMTRRLGIAWLKANSRRPQAYIVIAALAAKNPTDAEYKRRAAEWLDSNDSDPNAYILLASLVARDPSDALLRKRATQWLDADASHPSAYSLLARLIAGNPSDADVRERTARWLDANTSHPKAHSLLAPLVAGNPSDVAIREHAMRWLDVNSSHPNAQYLLASLVKANPSDAVVRERAMRSLDANTSNPNAYALLATLIAGNPSDAVIRERATQWLDANTSHPQQLELLKSLIAANPLDALLRERATRWLDANTVHPNAHELLRTLIVSNPSDADLRDRATQWLDANPSQTGAHELVRTLTASNPLDADLRDRAMRWLDANPSHLSSHSLLRTLVVGDPLNLDLRKRAVQWLDENSSCPQAHELLKVLYTANPLDDSILRRAREFLDRTDTTRTSRTELLKTLIARSNGDPEWLRKGVEYVQTVDAFRPEQIFAALLTGGKASAEYIDMALAYLSKAETRTQRLFLLWSLSRAADANPLAVASYLRGSATDNRKNTVRKSIAIAIKRGGDSPAALQCLQTLAEETPEQIPSILMKSIEVDVQTEAIDGFIEQWLRNNYRSHGYQQVLQKLLSRPAFSSRLRGRESMPPLVARDLAPRGLKFSSPVLPIKVPSKIQTTPSAKELPIAGERVDAELLEERTKKRGWRARHPATGLEGPIQNSGMVPSERQPGDSVSLVVKMATERVIAFAWPP